MKKSLFVLLALSLAVAAKTASADEWYHIGNTIKHGSTVSVDYQVRSDGITETATNIWVNAINPKYNERNSVFVEFTPIYQTTRNAAPLNQMAEVQLGAMRFEHGRFTVDFKPIIIERHETIDNTGIEGLQLLHFQDADGAISNILIDMYEPRRR